MNKIVILIVTIILGLTAIAVLQPLTQNVTDKVDNTIVTEPYYAKTSTNVQGAYEDSDDDGFYVTPITIKDDRSVVVFNTSSGIVWNYNSSTESYDSNVTPAIGGSLIDADFNHGGDLFVGANEGVIEDFLSLYVVSGYTFSESTDTLPTFTDKLSAVEILGDDYIVVGSRSADDPVSGTSRFAIFKKIGNSWDNLLYSHPSTDEVNSIDSVAHNDGSYTIAVGFGSTVELEVYTIKDDVVVEWDNSERAGHYHELVEFSPTGYYMYASTENGGQVYKFDYDNYYMYNVPTQNPATRRVDNTATWVTDDLFYIGGEYNHFVYENIGVGDTIEFDYSTYTAMADNYVDDVLGLFFGLDNYMYFNDYDGYHKVWHNYNDFDDMTIELDDTPDEIEYVSIDGIEVTYTLVDNEITPDYAPLYGGETIVSYNMIEERLPIVNLVPLLFAVIIVTMAIGYSKFKE